MRFATLSLALFALAAPMAAQQPACVVVNGVVTNAPCTVLVPKAKPDTVTITKTDTVKAATTTGTTTPAPDTTTKPATTTTTTTTSPSVGTPIVLEDFTRYTSTAALLGASDKWITGEAFHPENITLDTVGGKSMKYTWPNVGSTCSVSYKIMPGLLKFPNGLTEVWIEYVVRFATNFRVDAGTGPCAKEYKLAGAGQYGGGSSNRWDIAEMQAGQFALGAPGYGPFPTTTVAPSTLWNGQPHTFRAHLKLASDATGALEYWVDGLKVFSRVGIVTNNGTHKQIDNFAPGMNINQGPNISGMSMWWHKIAVYTSNPGW